MFDYNYYKQLKRPTTYLAYPNRNFVGPIRTYDYQTDIMGNSADKGTFKVYRYNDGVEEKYYSHISIGMALYMDGLGWFLIKELDRQNDGDNEYLDITYVAWEYLLSQTVLTSFGSLGVDTDSQGGLDRYCLYNPLDVEHSIMDIVIQKNPSWSIGYIDPDIITEYRNFQVESIDTYSFLTSNVAETYECVFIFDSIECTISAYKLENLGKDTSITLSSDNFLKSVTQQSDDSDIKTVLTVAGGNDARTNSPLDIVEVNVSGTNQIFDFSYYLHMMSPELRAKLAEYEQKCIANTPAYEQALATLGILYADYYDLMTRQPEISGSSNWNEYGLTPLQAEESKYRLLMSTYIDQQSETSKRRYSEYKAVVDAIQAELIVRQNEVNAKQTQITSCINTKSALVVNIAKFLGDTLYKELSLYVKEDTFTDDSFIATTIMSGDEILAMQEALLAHAKEELAKVCYPKFQTTIDLINFTVNYDFIKFTEQLEMFNIIHIRFEEQDALTDARLLKIHINWDDPNDFSVTISNRNSLDETFGLLAEIQEQTESMSSTLTYGVGAWANAASVSPEIQNYMNSVFDASKQQLQNSSNQDVIIDQTGLLIRKYNETTEKYDPGQLWATNGMLAFTRDAWDSVSLAIGYVAVNGGYMYGIAADTILGRLLIGSNLYISNASGTYTIDDNGMNAAKDGYKVTINPNTPSEIFSISINNTKLLYIDTTTSKLKFEGDIESTSGHIANFSINSNSLVSGGVGLCSDTTNSAIAIWAGNANKTIAPFRVNNAGQVICSNINISGGSVAINSGNENSKFVVNSDGSIIATNATIRGNITANSGNIGDFSIENGSIVNHNSGAKLQVGGNYIDRGGIESDAIMTNELTVGIYGGDAGVWIEDSGDIWIGGSFWDGQSLTDKMSELWDYVHGGGWCRRDDGCGDSCDSCDSCDCIDDCDDSCDTLEQDSGCPN